MLHALAAMEWAPTTSGTRGTPTTVEESAHVLHYLLVGQRACTTVVAILLKLVSAPAPALLDCATYLSTAVRRVPRDLGYANRLASVAQGAVERSLPSAHRNATLALVHSARWQNPRGYVCTAR